ncbi:MAG: putative metallopeptidase [Candidatus Anstonellales archaeon]
MEVEKALDVQQRIEKIIDALRPKGINQFRIICMRSRGSSSRAYARIWSMPKIWQKALDIGTFYVIEVLSERFDGLSDEDKTKVLIHELMHIPQTFSGALLSHGHRGGRGDWEREVEMLYREYSSRVRYMNK